MPHLRCICRAALCIHRIRRLYSGLLAFRWCSADPSSAFGERRLAPRIKGGYHAPDRSCRAISLPLGPIRRPHTRPTRCRTSPGRARGCMRVCYTPRSGVRRDPRGRSGGDRTWRRAGADASHWTARSQRSSLPGATVRARRGDFGTLAVKGYRFWSVVCRGRMCRRQVGRRSFRLRWGGRVRGFGRGERAGRVLDPPLPCA